MSSSGSADTSRRGLCVRGLCFAYAPGARIIDCVDLDAAPGEVHGVLGPSGCGKTTMLRIIAGLERATTGSISIDGRIVACDRVHVPPERRGVGYVFQDYALFPHLSVRGNVGFGLARVPRAERRNTVDALVERVGLAGLGDRMPHTLSGGQQQRVALARALAPEPSVMLLDEPFSSLDSALRADLREELLGLLRESGVATLMVTHDAAEVEAVVTRTTSLA